jgi:hypothetical protein
MCVCTKSLVPFSLSTGYGKTPKLPYVDDNARADLVLAAAKFGQQGKQTPLVLVSPSMSGCVRS